MPIKVHKGATLKLFKYYVIVNANGDFLSSMSIFVGIERTQRQYLSNLSAAAFFNTKSNAELHLRDGEEVKGVRMELVDE